MFIKFKCNNKDCDMYGHMFPVQAQMDGWFYHVPRVKCVRCNQDGVEINENVKEERCTKCDSTDSPMWFLHEDNMVCYTCYLKLNPDRIDNGTNGGIESTEVEENS